MGVCAPSLFRDRRRDAGLNDFEVNTFVSWHVVGL